MKIKEKETLVSRDNEVFTCGNCGEEYSKPEDAITCECWILSEMDVP